jgi:hypothetical protein
LEMSPQGRTVGGSRAESHTAPRHQPQASVPEYADGERHEPGCKCC